LRADLICIGPAASFTRYLVAGGTAIEVGEPLHTVGSTSSAGEASVNTSVLAAADTPVIGTHLFRGIATGKAKLAAAGTVLAQYLNTANPVPYIGRIRALALTKTEIDTASELAGVIGDFTLIDYNSTGGTDGGELYKIISDATADTSGLEVVGGNTALGTLDVVVAAQAYRSDVS